MVGVLLTRGRHHPRRHHPLHRPLAMAVRGMCFCGWVGGWVVFAAAAQQLHQHAQAVLVLWVQTLHSAPTGPKHIMSRTCHLLAPQGLGMLN